MIRLIIDNFSPCTKKKNNQISKIALLCYVNAATILGITTPSSAATLLKGGVPLVSASAAQTQWANRIIVELADPAIKSLPLTQLATTIGLLSTDAGFQLKPLFRLTERFMVLQVPKAQSASDVDAVVFRLKSSKMVFNVEADRVIHTFSGDTHYNDTSWPNLYQFYQAINEDSYTGAHAYNPNLYEMTVAGESAALSGIRVAVIDTGVSVNQKDLPASRFYDMETILNGKMTSGAADGASDSHGTAVAGIVGALANNNFGLAGLAPNVGLGMYKVFDDQGNGLQSDAELAALYAANLHDRNVIPQDNPTPANVINMSLGVQAACGISSQSVYDKITNAGIIVVAAAGNSSLNALATPAACNGVVSVGAANSKGYRASYSNAAPNLLVSTYGGDSSYNNLFPVLDPIGVVAGKGTSYASPVVASAIAFAKSYQPTLNYTSVASALTSTGNAFDAQDPSCAGKTSCGVLMNTQAFLKQVTGVDIVAVATGSGSSTGTGSGSSTGAGSGSGSAQTPAPTTHQYTQQDSSVATGKSNPTIRRADGANLNGATVSIVNDQVVVSMTDPGDYYVYYDGTPVSTQGTQTASVNRYGFTARLNSDGSTQGGQTIQVQSDQTAPPPITTSSAPTASTSTSSSGGGGGGGGGGGALGYAGILILWFGVGYLRRRVLRNTV